MDENKSWWDEETAVPPPLFGKFFEGWSSFFNKDDISQQKEYDDQDESSVTSETSSHTTSPKIHNKARRKSSIRLGNKVVSELLEKDNVRKAIEILQSALSRLDMSQTDEGENQQDISKIYSRIIKALCDPAILNIVDEMTPVEYKHDIYHSVLWRLFTKVVESGHVLEREAHLAVVSTLIDKGYQSLALQVMYTLPRREWDTQCYRTAILLHLMQEPRQVMEAQGLLSDYGKPFLELPNPIDPADLPPIRMETPLMNEVTESDQLKLWIFFQAAQSTQDDQWTKEKEKYEQQREENMKLIEQKRNSGIDWALEQFNFDSEKSKVDRLSTENDNTMIYVAMTNSQFEYGWQVYQAMGDAVNEDTPCIAMHLCWVAFRNIPIADRSYRTEWETRGWSVYSRFMCSEYLHPDQPEAPSFIHDILSIAAHSPEATVDKKARYTKSMTVYKLLVRLQFQKLLCDNRVLEPILCTLLYECKGTPTTIVKMCTKAFEIWDRKNDILCKSNLKSYSPYSILWGLVILSYKAGNEQDLYKVISQLPSSTMQENNSLMPSSFIAPIQKFHDSFLCSNERCYFYDYMFRRVEFTEDDSEPVEMNDFGFLLSGDHRTIDSYNQSMLSWCTNINEAQEPNIAMAVKMGAAKQENLVQKQMHFSTKKARAFIGHITKLIGPSTPDQCIPT